VINMSNNLSVIQLAVSAVLAVSGVAFVSSAVADDSDKEQCAGIIKAGKNDCATMTNQCHGHVTTDSSPEAWIYLPKGTCERLTGAHIVKVTDPTPKK